MGEMNRDRTGMADEMNLEVDYSATSNNMKLVHWPLMGGCYIWYREEGTHWAGP